LPLLGKQKNSQKRAQSLRKKAKTIKNILTNSFIFYKLPSQKLKNANHPYRKLKYRELSKEKIISRYEIKLSSSEGLK
jgi:hypothetical protein